MISTEEWRGLRKESDNLKIEKQKFSNLNNREKLTKKNLNKVSGTCGIIKIYISNFSVNKGELSRQDNDDFTENAFKEIMAEILSKLLNDIILQIQEADSIPNWMSPKKSMPRYITAKLLKTKDIFLKREILKAMRKR